MDNILLAKKKRARGWHFFQVDINCVVSHIQGRFKCQVKTETRLAGTGSNLICNHLYSSTEEWFGKREIKVNNSIQQGSGRKSNISVFTSDLWIKYELFFLSLEYLIFKSELLNASTGIRIFRFIITVLLAAERFYALAL